jgi:hypothetical protein
MLWRFYCLLDANTVLAVNPGLQLTVTVVELDGDSIMKDATCPATLNELILGDGCEAPHLGSIDLLATSNLVLGTTKRLQSVLADILTAADGAKNLADVHTSNCAVRFTEGATHSSLETIGTSTRKHFVDAQHMERMDADANVECILPCSFGHVLIAGNTASFKSLGGDLLELIRHKVCAEREVVD